MSDHPRLRSCELESFIEANKPFVEWQTVKPQSVIEPADPSGIYGSVDFDTAHRMLANKRFQMPEMGNLCVEDAVVAGYGLVLLRDRVLFDRNFTISQDEVGLYGYFTEVTVMDDGYVSCRYRDGGRVDSAVMLLHRGDTIHGHWLLEVLPRVMMAKKAGLHDPLYIVSDQIKEYQLEMLEAVGVRREKIKKIAPDEQIFCNRLVVSSIAHANSFWLHPFANDTYDYLVDLICGSSPTSNGFEKIFVTRASRRDDPRALLNLHEVTQVLEKSSYKPIDPGQITWRDQIKIFARAEHIIGIGGSGHHNTVFSRSDTDVMTMQPNQNWNYLQASIASIRGHSHAFFFGEALSAFDQTAWETPFVIDSDLLAILVK